jgi:hypothetical protein
MAAFIGVGVTIIINGHIIAPLFNAEAATHI